MKRKTHFATMWMSPLLSESRNLIQFHTESIQKSLVISRLLLPSLLHTNIRSFSEPNFHEHEAFRLVSRERARHRWFHQWKRHDRFPCPSFPLLHLIFNGDDYVKKRRASNSEAKNGVLPRFGIVSAREILPPRLHPAQSSDTVFWHCLIPSQLLADAEFVLNTWRYTQIPVQNGTCLIFWTHERMLYFSFMPSLPSKLPLTQWIYKA